MTAPSPNSNNRDASKNITISTRQRIHIKPSPPQKCPYKNPDNCAFVKTQCFKGLEWFEVCNIWQLYKENVHQVRLLLDDCSEDRARKCIGRWALDNPELEVVKS